MRIVRGGNFKKVMYWLQELRSWRRWTHQKSNRKDSKRKRWSFLKKENSFSQSLRTYTLIRQRPIWGENHLDFLGESEASLPPSQEPSPDAGEAMNDFWSMSGNFIYNHHFEPRVKLYWKRVTPYSTEVHWCFQNSTYEFGCQARKTHRWLLEYRWVTRFVRSLDRFHTIYFTRWKSSWRIHVVRVGD